MNKGKKWLYGIVMSLTYITVSAVSVLITLVLCSRNPGKIPELEAIIHEKFIDEIDEAAIEDAASHAMVAALGDRWSYYIPAEDMEKVRERKNNAYVGIGITIQKDSERKGFQIVKVEPEGPAQKAGILNGDLIIAAEDRDVAEMEVQDLKAIIQGKPDTEVGITVMRDGKSLEFSMMRAKIPVIVAKGEMLPGNLGLVTIANFNTNCGEETIREIRKLVDQGAKGLIFDVRNNGGGYVTEMIEVLDYLLPEGMLFQSVDYQGKETVEKSDSSCVELPMAVIVNENTYSAAEYFAAVLEEYDWALTAGTPTSGKGHFQYTLPLRDGSAVNLSVGHYLTPKGVNLEEKGGLIPGISAEVDEETAAMIYGHAVPAEKDPQIQAAANALKASQIQEKSK